MEALINQAMPHTLTVVPDKQPLNCCSIQSTIGNVSCVYYLCDTHSLLSEVLDHQVAAYVKRISCPILIIFK